MSDIKIGNGAAPLVERFAAKLGASQQDVLPLLAELRDDGQTASFSEAREAEAWLEKFKTASPASSMAEAFTAFKEYADTAKAARRQLYTNILNTLDGSTNRAQISFKHVLEVAQQYPTIPFADLGGVYVDILKAEEGNINHAKEGLRRVLEAAQQHPNTPFVELGGAYVDSLKAEHGNINHAEISFQRSLEAF